MINERLYEIRNNHQGTPMKIVRYGNWDDIDIEFLDDFHYIKKHQIYSNFKSGSVKNPYDRIVHGVGYIGLGNHPTKVDGKTSRTYNIWHEIIARCYGEKEKEKYPAYFGISSVCDEWHCFHTFADWYESKKYPCDGRLHIDKDILYRGNKIYAPDKCLLVPQKINMLFMNKPNNRGLPNGIEKQGNDYLAKYKHEHIGVYPTVEEAYYYQTKKKKEEIIRVANEYKTIMPDYVYEAILAYEFDIHNDKNYVVA